MKKYIVIILLGILTFCLIPGATAYTKAKTQLKTINNELISTVQRNDPTATKITSVKHKQEQFIIDYKTADGSNKIIMISPDTVAASISKAVDYYQQAKRLAILLPLVSIGATMVITTLKLIRRLT